MGQSVRLQRELAREEARADASASECASLRAAAASSAEKAAAAESLAATTAAEKAAAEDARDAATVRAETAEAAAKAAEETARRETTLREAAEETARDAAEETARDAAREAVPGREDVEEDVPVDDARIHPVVAAAAVAAERARAAALARHVVELRLVVARLAECARTYDPSKNTDGLGAHSESAERAKGAHSERLKPTSRTPRKRTAASLASLAAEHRAAVEESRDAAATAAAAASALGVELERLRRASDERRDADAAVASPTLPADPNVLAEIAARAAG